MEKAFLERCLAEGLSLEQIGKRVGRNPSTISYHLKKFGLVPAYRQRHLNLGTISEADLRGLVDEDLTLHEIATRLDRSVSTIRYWLKKYDLPPVTGSRNRRDAQRARKAGLKRAALECRHHGLTEFALEARGSYRCVKCRQERVSEWRRRVKRRLVEGAGRACAICGYDKCVSALHFHHLDPSQKLFALSRQGVTRSFAEAQAEAEKCVLLCSNCHAEVEAGMAKVPALRRSG
jgi:transposase